MNWSAALVALVPEGVTTVMSTAPAVPAGETALMVVAEVTSKLVAATEPKLTALAPTKPVPVTVAEVLPVVGPVRGLSELTTGAPW